MVELKYLKRDRGRGAGAFRPRRAKDQLRGYLGDERLAQQHPSIQFTGIALVFRGWELVAAEAIGDATASQ